jgi:hypothetical protein
MREKSTLSGERENVMAETLQSLFDAYCSYDESSDRYAFAISVPRLLWSKSVAALLPLASGARHGRLAELDRLRQVLLMRPEGYPIGDGPIEQLMASNRSPTQILDICRSTELLAIVAPPYLRELAYHGADQARTDDWETGAWVSRFATEAALAWHPDAPIEHDIGEVVLAHIEMALYALARSLDETVFNESLSAATTLLERAEQTDNFELIGKLCQSIGSLWSDIWAVPGSPQDSEPVRVEEWLRRPRKAIGIFSSLGPPKGLPGVDECLLEAIAWYKRALPYRSGAARGLSYKAIVQTQHFGSVVLKMPVDDAELKRFWGLAEDLLLKHEHADVHLQVLQSIASARHWSKPITLPQMESADRVWLGAVEAAYEPGNDADPSVENRRKGHAQALHDLQRVVRHRLPWALYLRNFKHANDIRMLGDLITHESEGNVHIVVPQISYSLVDHKILQLFEEGVITVCDPAIADTHRTTPIPMLSLRDEEWLRVVRVLIEHCTRVVMLLDELTPGVQSELDLLCELGANDRALLVCGHAFRDGKATLAPAVSAAFPYIVDWIDFGYDESHHDMHHKAHRIIQHHLLRYVRANAGPVVRAWLY